MVLNYLSLNFSYQILNMPLLHLLLIMCVHRPPLKLEKNSQYPSLLSPTPIKQKKNFLAFSLPSIKIRLDRYKRHGE